MSPTPRPTIAPATTNGTNTPPTPPPARVVAVARHRRANTAASSHRACSSDNHRITSYPVPIVRLSPVSRRLMTNSAAKVMPAPNTRSATGRYVTALAYRTRRAKERAPIAQQIPMRIAPARSRYWNEAPRSFWNEKMGSVLLSATNTR